MKMMLHLLWENKEIKIELIRTRMMNIMMRTTMLKRMMTLMIMSNNKK
jgi:hypothetical protein